MRTSVALLTSFVLVVWQSSPHTLALAVAEPLQARVVAVGIPGAGAIAPVGVFHVGGPVHDVPALAGFTGPGRVLDPVRLLVASSSNFGAPRARPDWPSGTVLSIDPRGPDPIVVPAEFAARGGQSEALDGRVQVYTGQSSAFLNRLTSPGAVTADLPAISNPLGISINNGFGRPWVASAPYASASIGTESVLDPDGRPLASAPSPAAGGVFAGSLTNRPDQRVAGVLLGAVGNALLGPAPDGSGKAVFAVLNVDGSVVQVHVRDGVEGLLPAGTVSKLPDVGLSSVSAGDPVAARAGMLFNWVPDPRLYIADPHGNDIVALALGDDGRLVHVERMERLTAAELSVPIDLAPAVPEVSNPRFSSNTTLAGGSDLYVANRGSGTITRLRQDGTVVADRQIDLPRSGPLGPNELNGIATSPDAQRIWLTVSSSLDEYPGTSGAVVEVPAFGAPGDAYFEQRPLLLPADVGQAVDAQNGPAQTVITFYRLLEQSDFETLQRLLSDGMRASFPSEPQLLRGRPPSGKLTVRRADLIAEDEAGIHASVAVDVLETIATQPAATRRYVGIWRLVRGSDGWLLDEPEIEIQ